MKGIQFPGVHFEVETSFIFTYLIRTKYIVSLSVSISENIVFLRSLNSCTKYFSSQKHIDRHINFGTSIEIIKVHFSEIAIVTIHSTLFESLKIKLKISVGLEISVAI